MVDLLTLAAPAAIALLIVCAARRGPRHTTWMCRVCHTEFSSPPYTDHHIAATHTPP